MCCKNAQMGTPALKAIKHQGEERCWSDCLAEKWSDLRGHIATVKWFSLGDYQVSLEGSPTHDRRDLSVVKSSVISVPVLSLPDLMIRNQRSWLGIGESRMKDPIDCVGQQAAVDLEPVRKFRLLQQWLSKVISLNCGVYYDFIVCVFTVWITILFLFLFLIPCTNANCDEK
jgi:hypothetical protein